MRWGRAAAAVLLLALTTPVVRAAATTTAPSAPSAPSAPDGGRSVDGRYREFGDGGGFLNILPAGQNSGLTAEGLDRVTRAIDGNGQLPAHYADQQALYDSLVHAPAELTAADLDQYFKDASFGVEPRDVGRVYRPHDDVTVVRDKSFGVAHIFGRTRYATLFAEGFTTAEDRLFFMDVLRHTGRGLLSELVGLSAGEARDKGQTGESPYPAPDLGALVEALRDAGPDGAVIVEDLQAYTDGVNAFMQQVRRHADLLPAEYALLGRDPEPWVPEDTVAIATLVGGIFGRGGGRELANACGVDALAERLGDGAAALAVFDDLHFADDPESPTTSGDEAPYLTRPDSVATGLQPDLDCATLRPVSDASPEVSTAHDDGLGGGFDLLPAPVADSVARVVGALDRITEPREASNALLVSGDHTDTGRPIAVFGPQVGYSAPELLTEKDVHGPGIDARGVAFLGVDAYVQLGRGDTYAWSATSSGADNVDQVVLRLCDPAGGAATIDSTGYEHDGECVPFETWNHEIDAPATPLGPEGTRSWRVERAADYGPVTHHATLRDGTPVAIATHRSTYGAELGSALGFKQLNDPRFMSGGYDAFREATGEHIDYTFNWFYVDADDVGYQHSCRCPVRDPRIDPYFPAWGTGEHDWQGYLDADAQPHARNPDSGYIVSWNNRQAPGFGANDGNFSYGPVHRSLTLSNRIEERIAASEADGGSPVTRADVVEVMIDAATVDLRGAAVLPLLLEVMGEPPEGAADRLLDLRERLEIWSDLGAHRADRDGDGEYDDAVAPAVMDAWWPLVVGAVFGDAGAPFDALDVSIDDHPGGHGGSAFASGAYGQVVRDLSTVLGAGLDNAPAFSRPYCGAGDRDRCSAVLWASLGEAADALAEEFETPEVAAWQRAVADDEIRYQSLVAGMPPMDWQNRPTFQQVVQLETDRSTGDSGGRPTAEPGDSDGDGPSVPLLFAAAAVAGALALAVHRRRRAR